MAEKKSRPRNLIDFFFVCHIQMKHMRKKTLFNLYLSLCIDEFIEQHYVVGTKLKNMENDLFDSKNVRFYSNKSFIVYSSINRQQNPNSLGFGQSCVSILLSDKSQHRKNTIETRFKMHFIVKIAPSLQDPWNIFRKREQQINSFATVLYANKVYAMKSPYAFICVQCPMQFHSSCGY